MESEDVDRAQLQWLDLSDMAPPHVNSDCDDSPHLVWQATHEDEDEDEEEVATETQPETQTESDCDNTGTSNISAAVRLRLTAGAGMGIGTGPATRTRSATETDGTARLLRPRMTSVTLEIEEGSVFSEHSQPQQSQLYAQRQSTPRSLHQSDHHTMRPSHPIVTHWSPTDVSEPRVTLSDRNVNCCQHSYHNAVWGECWSAGCSHLTPHSSIRSPSPHSVSSGGLTLPCSPLPRQSSPLQLSPQISHLSLCSNDSGRSASVARLPQTISTATMVQRAAARFRAHGGSGDTSSVGTRSDGAGRSQAGDKYIEGNGLSSSAIVSSVDNDIGRRATCVNVNRGSLGVGVGLGVGLGMTQLHQQLFHPPPLRQQSSESRSPAAHVHADGVVCNFAQFTNYHNRLTANLTSAPNPNPNFTQLIQSPGTVATAAGCASSSPLFRHQRQCPSPSPSPSESQHLHHHQPLQPQQSLSSSEPPTLDPPFPSSFHQQSPYESRELPDSLPASDQHVQKIEYQRLLQPLQGPQQPSQFALSSTHLLPLPPRPHSHLAHTATTATLVHRAATRWRSVAAAPHPSLVVTSDNLNVNGGHRHLYDSQRAAAAIAVAAVTAGVSAVTATTVVVGSNPNANGATCRASASASASGCCVIGSGSGGALARAGAAEARRRRRISDRLQELALVLGLARENSADAGTDGEVDGSGDGDGIVRELSCSPPSESSSLSSSACDYDISTVLSRAIQCLRQLQQQRQELPPPQKEKETRPVIPNPLSDFRLSALYCFEIVATLEGEIVSVSDSFCAGLGLTRDNVIGHRLCDGSATAVTAATDSAIWRDGDREGDRVRDRKRKPTSSVVSFQALSGNEARNHSDTSNDYNAVATVPEPVSTCGATGDNMSRSNGVAAMNASVPTLQRQTRELLRGLLKLGCLCLNCRSCFTIAWTPTAFPSVSTSINMPLCSQHCPCPALQVDAKEMRTPSCSPVSSTSSDEGLRESTGSRKVNVLVPISAPNINRDAPYSSPIPSFSVSSSQYLSTKPETAPTSMNDNRSCCAGGSPGDGVGHDASLCARLVGWSFQDGLSGRPMLQFVAAFDHWNQ